jgi:hypothetical protein
MVLHELPLTFDLRMVCEYLGLFRLGATIASYLPDKKHSMNGAKHGVGV